MVGFLEQVPLVLVLSAGFVTLLSPCGYILLPTYVTYYLGGEVTLRGALRGASRSSSASSSSSALLVSSPPAHPRSSAASSPTSRWRPG